MHGSTYVQRERVALQEELQVGIFAQDGVVGNLLNTSLQCHATVLNKLVVEPAKCVLLWDRRHHNTRVVE